MKKILSTDQIQIGRLIGEGEHGEVRLCRFTSNHQLAAVKVIDLQVGQRMYNREVEAMHRLEHPGIVGYYGQLVDDNQFGYVVMEYYPHSTLEKTVAKHGCFSEPDALRVLAQLLDAVNYMHQQGVAHRDIKCDNILFNWDTKQAKIIDFGLSHRFTDATKTSHEHVGTPSNMPPELLARQYYSPLAADVWSLGIVFLELLLGYHPYAEAEDERDLMRLQREHWEWSVFSPPVAHLVQAMLAVDATRRFTVPSLRALVHMLLAGHQHLTQQQHVLPAAVTHQHLQQHSAVSMMAGMSSTGNGISSFAQAQAWPATSGDALLAMHAANAATVAASRFHAAFAVNS